MDDHRFGFVTLAGPPNVGKSTLINRFIGQKISIVTRKPQTTRHRIIGIKSTEQYQIAFVDTPGLHVNEKKTLNKVINKTAISSMTDVDLVIFMMDDKGWNPWYTALLKYIQLVKVPVILVINKIDKLKQKSELLPIIKKVQDVFPFKAIIPISALNQQDTERLLQTLYHHLPTGPPGFPSDQITNRSEKFLAAEMIREQAFLRLGEEVPYACAVEISQFIVNDKGVLHIGAMIWVDKPGQKAIVIGKNGEQLKNIGQAARKQMERVFKRKIYLNTWVKVKKGWADSQSILQALGYSELE